MKDIIHVAVSCFVGDRSNKLFVGMNVGLNVGLQKTEQKILECIILDKDETAETLSVKLSVSKRTVERYLSALQEKGYLQRVGSRRDGFWIVIS